MISHVFDEKEESRVTFMKFLVLNFKDDCLRDFQVSFLKKDFNLSLLKKYLQ